jgi:hypothetical protein
MVFLKLKKVCAPPPEVRIADVVTMVNEGQRDTRKKCKIKWEKL